MKYEREGEDFSVLSVSAFDGINTTPSKLQRIQDRSLSLSVHLFLVQCYPILQSSGEDHLLHQVKRGERDTHMGRFPSALPTSASLISPLHEVCSSIAHDHHVVQSNVLARPLALLPSPLRSSSSSPRPQPCCLPARPAARPSGGEMSSFGPMPPSE